MPDSQRDPIELTELEGVLRQTLAEVLRIEVDDIDPDEILSDHGLDSIVAVEWIRDINKRYSILLNTSKVYEFPTIRKMALLVQQTRGQLRATAPDSEAVPLVPLAEECRAASQSHPAPATSSSQRLAMENEVTTSASGENASIRQRQLEQELTASLAESLRIDDQDIDPERILSEIGLDSIVAVEWIRDINRRYSILLNTSKVYEFPTIRTLAMLVGQLRDGTASATQHASGTPPQVVKEAKEKTLAGSVSAPSKVLSPVVIPEMDSRAAMAISVPDPTISEPNSTLAAQSRVFASQLRLDTLIGSDILRAASQLAPPADLPPTQVLLTGASGFVGRFLALALGQGLDARGGTLYCLVRAASDEAARQRLVESLAASTELQQRLVALERSGRLVVLAGDLTKPRLGLEQPTWDRLAHKVEAIVHNGALVNHLLAYNQLHGTNVHGTAEVIRLALSGKKKTINFLSSIAVGNAVHRSEPIHEGEKALELYDNCLGAGRYAAGYAASKWAGEALLQEAWEKWSVPVKVFRCGMLLPHSTHRGFVNLGDVFSRFLVSLVQTGIAPPSLHFDSSRPVAAGFRGLPVDVAARSIAQISLGAETGYSIYHVLSSAPGAPSLDQLVDWIQELGYPIDRLQSTQAWRADFMQRLEALSARPRSYSLYSSVYQLDELQDVLDQPEFDSHRFAERTRSLIDGPAVRDCLAPIDRGFISRYLDELGDAELI